SALCIATPPTHISTLSLHDALPIFVCGLTTAMCVTQTAREASDRGFGVVIAEDACTELSEEMHEAALMAFSWIFTQLRTRILGRSEEHTSELQSLTNLVCRLLLAKN